MTERQANIINEYLLYKAKLSGNTAYYLNTMNGNEELGLKVGKDANLFKRDSHAHSHITVITYLDYGKGWKGFDTREYYYVVLQNNVNDIVTLRKDLVDSWAAHNARERVLIINEDGRVWDMCMNQFFGYGVTKKIKWNNEGNINLDYNLKSPTYLSNNTEDKDASKYIMESWNYIEHTVYASHRTGRRLKVAMYNADGTLKSYHIFKSINQLYDICKFSNYGCKRNFRRKFNDVLNIMFLENAEGKKFWVSTDESVTVPKTWNEPAVEEEPVVEESAIDIASLAEEALAITSEPVETKIRWNEWSYDLHKDLVRHYGADIFGYKQYLKDVS